MVQDTEGSKGTIWSIYKATEVISEQGAKVTAIQQSPLYLLPGEDIEDDIVFCHLNH